MGCTISIRFFFFSAIVDGAEQTSKSQQIESTMVEMVPYAPSLFYHGAQNAKTTPHFPRYVSHSSHTIHPSVHPHKQANICSSSVPLPTYHIPSCCTPVTSTTRACRLHSLSTTSCPQPTMPISPPDASFPTYPSPSPKLGGL